jgi:hypothetical protein
MTDRRGFLAGLGALWTSYVAREGARAAPVVDARPTALYQQPDGRRNLVRVTATGVAAPAARARVLDRRGALVGTAGLLPTTGGALAGEVWVPLSEPSEFRIDVEVGRSRVARRTLRLTPPRRWTVYLLSTVPTRVGYTDLQERALETHRRNLDAALARLTDHPDYRWTPECALQVMSYLENRSPAAGEALLTAIRDGKVGLPALFANLLTGLLDHETLARAVWPAGMLARDQGLVFAAAHTSGAPGQTLTFPLVLAASGVRYLASLPNAERALPLLSSAEAEPHGLRGDWPAYPQLYWWEGPDGSRVLHWRGSRLANARALGFGDGVLAAGSRLSDWLLTHPVFVSPAWSSDMVLVHGLEGEDNAPISEAMIATVEEFRQRYAFPRLVPGRAEDFFREVERRHGGGLPARRGDTGLYWEDGAASTAVELALFRRAQLAGRAAEILALWDARVEPRDAAAPERLRRRAEERQVMWRDLLLFGEQTWGAAASVAEPDAPQTVAQWEYKRRYLQSAWAAARRQVDEGLLRIGRSAPAGSGRLVFNASSWDRTDIVRVPGGAGRALTFGDRDLPAVDLADGAALVLARDVPALGYLALTEREREPRPASDDGAALEATAGGFTCRLDPGTGAVASLVGSDGRERVKTSSWSGLNQLIHAQGGARSALWTGWSREDLRAPPDLGITQARLVSARRERLTGIGVRLVVERHLERLPGVVSTVTLYDELPWVDIENRFTKAPTDEKEAVYVAFPFAFTAPTVEVEVPLGRMTVERDQQPGSGRDWFCHAHWVSLREGADGLLWSGPDTPLFTLNDVCRGTWRRRIEPDGTLFAYVLHNYWHTNFAARQGGEFTTRFRLSVLPPGDPAEPVRRGWAACDPLYVSESYANQVSGPLLGRDRALFLADRGVLVIGAKPADDGDGAILKLLDVTGVARPVGIWPAAWEYAAARRTNLVELNEGDIPLSAERRAAVDLRAWGVGAARLFTPRAGAG